MNMNARRQKQLSLTTQAPTEADTVEVPVEIELHQVRGGVAWDGLWWPEPAGIQRPQGRGRQQSLDGRARSSPNKMSRGSADSIGAGGSIQTAKSRVLQTKLRKEQSAGCSNAKPSTVHGNGATPIHESGSTPVDFKMVTSLFLFDFLDLVSWKGGGGRCGLGSW